MGDSPCSIQFGYCYSITVLIGQISFEFSMTKHLFETSNNKNFYSNIIVKMFQYN